MTALWIACGAGIVVFAGCCVCLVLCELRKPRVMCLMYHRLADRDTWKRARGTERIFTLPADEFDRQLAYLKQQGFSFLSPEDVHAYVMGEKNLSDPSVLVTFDDGCQSVLHHAQPILEKHGARATVFVTTDPESYVFHDLGSSDPRMTDEELQQLDKGVVQCESHCVTHQPLRAMSDKKIRWELAESKRELERVVGQPVRFLAVPGNWFDRRVMRIAREVGYEAVWYSFPGITRRRVSVWGLPRINVEGLATLDGFASSICPWGIIQRRIVSLIKRVPGRLLGPRFWLPLRKIILSVMPGRYLSFRRIAIGAAILVLLTLLAAFKWLR